MWARVMPAPEAKKGPLVGRLPTLAAELAITLADPSVWLAIGLALLLGGLSLVFGTWVARTVGLLRSDAPAGETLGVGLASGLMVLAAWWAALWSGGRSSFTPVAVGFAIALALALARRVRRPAAPAVLPSAETDAPPASGRSSRRRSLLLTVCGGAAVVVVVALLYGATLAPSPRNGVQPVEFWDEPYYAVLGRDLATTGTETADLPSGFTELPGLPTQTWYHWGELWLAAALITVFGTAPLAARYYIVLPLLVLAAGALTGTLVRRMNGTSSRAAYLFGFLACLFLAPVPLLPGPEFSSWATGLIVGIKFYGLAAVAALLALYGLAVLRTRPPSWALAGFAGTGAALLLPAHIVIAVLALVGVGSVWSIRIAPSLWATHRLPAVSPIWRRTIIWTAIVLAASAAWGVVTGHGLGGSGLSPGVSPFNWTWWDSLAITTLGAGAFLAIPIAWFLARREAPLLADLCLGTLALLVVGAIAWGARLADFNMFHVFFGGLAIFATPVAAVAVWRLLARLQATKHLRLAFGVGVLCVLQLEWGATAGGVARLQDFGKLGNYQPIPVSLLATIRALPADAELAYACNPFEEVGFTEPRLVSIDAHTGHRIVPLCFEADYFGASIGGRQSAQSTSPGFTWAPQRVLYPDAAAHPSPAAVAAFLKDHGIDYIFADTDYPNTLVPDAVLIARDGGAEVLRVP